MVKKSWDVIALACRNRHHADTFQRELKIRQKKGLIDRKVLLLTVEDPDDRIGSGGATINAILVVAEHLSALAGYTVVNSDVLLKAHILILLMGRNYIFDPCGRAFTTLSAVYQGNHHVTNCNTESLACNIDFLLFSLTNIICSKSPPGVWVCSTDMLLSVPTDLEVHIPNGTTGVSLMTIPASIEYATKHGACKFDCDNTVENIFYKSPPAQLKSCILKDDKVPLVSGLLYMCPSTAEQLMQFHTKPPIDACTYMGIDSGSQPIKLSLFFDILLSMANDVTRESFVRGDRSGSYGSKGDNQQASKGWKPMERVRSILYDELHHIQFHSVLLHGCSHSYMSTVDYRSQILKCPLKYGGCCDSNNFRWQARAHCYAESGCELPRDSVIINSYITSEVDIGRECIISNSILKNKLKIGDRSILSGFLPEEFEDEKTTVAPITLPDNTVLLNFVISIGDGDASRRITIVFGIDDSFQLAESQDGSSFCNKPWSTFYQRTGITKADLWESHLAPTERCLFTAKLYPILHHNQKIGIVDLLWLLGSTNFNTALEKWRSSWRLSLREIMNMVDPAAAFAHKRQLYLEIGEKNLEVALVHQDSKCFLPFLQTCVAEDYKCILSTLDRVACTTDNLAIASRSFACIADILGIMAAARGGLRSGPAANNSWKLAFRLLEDLNICGGITLMAREREKWLKKPDMLVRAARHYEGAQQILIRKAVSTTKTFVKTTKQKLPPINTTWVVATSGARIDLAGGWSDTPPLTYEHGGVVVNAAISVDGKRPIGAKARRTTDLHIKLVLNGGSTNPVIVICTKVSDLEDYNQPHAPGALLKAAVLCAEIISLDSSTPLVQQLKESYGSGFELHTWADLPHGSGLGTSSILAGAIMACLFNISGRKCDNDSIIHSVLYLEQMLTTGGGWQDQVGGLVDGIKIARSPAELPLKVNTTKLEVKDSFMDDLDKRLLLIYTGKTRLAKNLLQDVLRRWYGKLPDIVSNVNNLTENAEKSAKSITDGDLETVGKCLDEYWKQKKIMAPGCEPAVVKRMMVSLTSYCYGQALAGAGGGGFMCIITKEPNFIDQVKSIISGIKGTDNVSVHRGMIDRQGLVVSHELDSNY